MNGEVSNNKNYINLTLKKNKSEVFQRKGRASFFTPNDIVYNTINKCIDKNKFYDKILTELKLIENNITDIKLKNKSKNIKEKEEEDKEENKTNNILDPNLLILINKAPEKRTYIDLIKLKNYLLNTKLVSHYNELKLDKESIEKLLTIFSLEMKGLKFNENENIYSLGELSKYIYLIILGKVEEVKPVKEESEMTGFEYFSYLMELIKNKEFEIYNMTIKENNNLYFIDKNDKEKIQYYFIVNTLNQIKNGFLINFKEILDLCNITPQFLGLEENKINSSNYIISNLKNILYNIPELTEDKLSYYLFFQENFIKKKVFVFKPKIISKLEEGDFFGYSSQIEIKRDESMRAKENSFIVYLDNSIYEYFFSKEKYSIINKEIDFLRDNFIFSKIHKKKFEKEYFNLFKIEEYKRGEILSYEFTPIKYIYFIKNGEVELYTKKNSIQIQSLLNEFKKTDLSNSNFFTYKYNTLKTNIIELKKDLEQNKISKLVSLKEKEIIGLECVYYSLNNLTTSQISEDKTIIYKISLDDFFSILNSNSEIFLSIEKVIKKRLDMLYFRFFNVNNIKISLADLKENYRQQFEIEKELNAQNKNELNQKNEKNKVLFDLQKNYKIKTKNSTLPVLTKKSNSLKRIIINENKLKKIRENNKRKLSKDESNISRNYSFFSFEDNMLKKIKKNIIEEQNQKNYFVKNDNTIQNENHSFEINDNHKNIKNQNFESNTGFAFYTQLPNINNLNNNQINLNISKNQKTKKKINHPYYDPFVIEKLRKYSIFDQNFLINDSKEDENEQQYQFEKPIFSYSQYKLGNKIRQKIKIENEKRKSVLYRNFKNQIREDLINCEN